MPLFNGSNGGTLTRQRFKNIVTALNARTAKRSSLSGTTPDSRVAGANTGGARRLPRRLGNGTKERLWP
jgi:hypothetical protein